MVAYQTLGRAIFLPEAFLADIVSEGALLEDMFSDANKSECKRDASPIAVSISLFSSSTPFYKFLIGNVFPKL